jgi:hypothetical protein
MGGAAAAKDLLLSRACPRVAHAVMSGGSREATFWATKERGSVRTDEAAQAITGVLSPHLGESMAHAAVCAQIEKLKIGTTIRPPEVEALLAKLASGLNVFVGPTTSAGVVEGARRAVARLEHLP